MSITLTVQFDSISLQLVFSGLCALFSGGNFFVTCWKLHKGKD